jgi:hypothetical protein
VEVGRAVSWAKWATQEIGWRAGGKKKGGRKGGGLRIAAGPQGLLGCRLEKKEGRERREGFGEFCVFFSNLSILLNLNPFSNFKLLQNFSRFKLFSKI